MSYEEKGSEVSNCYKPLRKNNRRSNVRAAPAVGCCSQLLKSLDFDDALAIRFVWQTLRKMIKTLFSIR